MESGPTDSNGSEHFLPPWSRSDNSSCSSDADSFADTDCGTDTTLSDTSTNSDDDSSSSSSSGHSDHNHSDNMSDNQADTDIDVYIEAYRTEFPTTVPTISNGTANPGISSSSNNRLNVPKRNPRNKKCASRATFQRTLLALSLILVCFLLQHVIITTVTPVSYTHLTLPTTPYV